MADDEITYRLTIWVDDQQFDWTYTIPDESVEDKHTIANGRVPLDDLPDELQDYSGADLEGCEFVASNDRDEGMNGVVKSTEHYGTVLVLDEDRPHVTGDDFGDPSGLGPGPVVNNAGPQSVLPGGRNGQSGNSP